MNDATPCCDRSEFEKQLLKRIDEQERINRRLLQQMTQLAIDVGRYVDAALDNDEAR